MKRTLALILSAFLLLGMIPSTFLTAIAAGPGVMSNGFQNQSQNTANNPEILETVIIDGNVDTDVAWATNKWNEVDTTNGTWDKENPAEESKKLTYKYQLHYDYEYFYGAIVLGKDIKDAEITIWLKVNPESTGYTHKVLYTVANGAVTDGGMVDVNGAQVGDAKYNAQKYLMSYKTNDGKVTIEFRRYLDTFTKAADAADAEYFVSVKYNKDSLYYPRIKIEGELSFFEPNATYWPSSEENLLTRLEDLNDLSSIEIDGEFNEAVWLGLTDYYTGGDGSNYIDFGNVGYNDTYQPSANSTTSDIYLGVYENNKYTAMTKNDTRLIKLNNGKGRGEVKFKYLYRVDGEYFYCAVIAEVPTLIYDEINVEGQNPNKTSESLKQTLKADPTLTIYFYNQTYKAFNIDKQDVSSTLRSEYNGWVPEHMLSLNTNGKANAINANGLINCSPRVDNGVVSGISWTEFATDDTYGQNNYEINGVVNPNYVSANSAWSLQDKYYDEADTYISGTDANGKSIYSPTEVQIWHFETRIELKHIMSSKAKKSNADKGLEPGDEGFDVGDLKFSISVSDRPWVEPFQFTDKDAEGNKIKGYKYYTDSAKGEYVIAKNYYRNSAWTGKNNRFENYPYYDAINAIDLSNTKPSGDFLSGITIDSNFDKQNNTELIAADSRVNGSDRVITKVSTSSSTNTALKNHGTYNSGGYDNPTQANGLLPVDYLDNKFGYNPYSGIQYAHNVTADHEFLYFALAAKNLKDGDTFRIWTNPAGFPVPTTLSFDHAVAFQYNSGAVKFDSWYHEGKVVKDSAGTAIQPNHDIAYQVIGGILYVEARIRLTDLGITPTLAPDDDEVLFYYYFTAEDFGTHTGQGSGQNNGLVSPRPQWGNIGNQGFPNVNRTDEFAGKVYYRADGASSADLKQYECYMLDYIKIDGKLDEEIWDEKSDRISVSGENGKWTVTPVKNEGFEYSYVLYTGENYIYGAVELDDNAILKSASQTGNYTQIKLWLANPGAMDGWGEYEDGAKYDNYAYTIYLADNGYTGDKSVKVEGPSGQMCGLTSPVVRDSDFKWAITSANGKTYAEFMIDTESYSKDDPTKSLFYMEDKAEYYISVKHGKNEFYDGKTDYNTDITLTYPAPDEKFYLTHYENPHAEGAGVIYTNLTDTGSNNYLGSTGRWWYHVMFKAHPESGGWEIVGIRDGNTAAPQNGKYGFTAEELQKAGADFVYCINVGNNYINVIEVIKKPYDEWVEKYTKDNGTAPTQAERTAKLDELITSDSLANYFNHEKKAALHVNFSSNAAYYMSQAIEKTWSVGRIVLIEELNSKLKGTIPAQVEAMLKTQENAQEKTTITRYFKDAATPWDATQVVQKPSFIYPDQQITHALPVVVKDTIPFYHEAGYKFIFTYKMYDPNPKYAENLPTASVWYQDNAGKLEEHEKTVPETIFIDGNLNDAGWAEDGWITVNENINASAQIGTADSFSFKYQIRNDGKYLYVAAVLEGVEYNSANRPYFTLWTKNSTSDNWTNKYRIGYGIYDDSFGYVRGVTIPEILDINEANRYQSQAIKDAIGGASTDNLSELFEGLEIRDNKLYVKNGGYTVHFGNDLEAVTNSSETKLQYHDSAIYGYTETIEEYVRNFYYPDIEIEIEKYVFGKQSGVIKADENGYINGLPTQENKSTVLEFRVGLDEIDPDNSGFEYFVSASRSGNGGEYALYYPTVYSEPESEFSYYNDHFPFKEWYSETAIKVTPEDLKGDMYLANDYAPVVTLGAKLNDNVDGANAIRFGAVYNEDLIRRQSGAGELDYWHVYDMGMLVAPTQKLGAGIDAFNSEDENVERISSIGIENWIENSNFADYESFVFYVTVTNIPDTYKKVKFSARPYIDYYNDFSNVEIYYGSAIERSLEMISNNQNQD